MSAGTLLVVGFAFIAVAVVLLSSLLPILTTVSHGFIR